MATTPFSTVAGYGGSGTLQVQPSGAYAGFVDTLDGFPALIGSITAGTGALAAIQIDPSALSSSNGMPIMNAVLIELRVIAELLHSQLGASQIDLQQLRAGIAYDINPATGVL